MGEFGPGSPPKRRRLDVLNADKVCHATNGPWLALQLPHPEMNCQGTEEVLKGWVRSSVRRSLVTGAEE